jgi:hypothetical protein
MTFRGYFALDGEEFANSSRLVSHLGRTTPRSDVEVFGTADCSLVFAKPGLATIPAGTVGDDLYAPPRGSRKFGPGLMEVGDCWKPVPPCACTATVGYDDTWTGLQQWLRHPMYRPELAPWHSVEIPESAEFHGVWVVKVTGLDTTQVVRTITQAVGNGAVGGMSRDTSRLITFEALLVGCTSAGLQHGLNWLTCQLRRAASVDGATLTFLSAHPEYSAADPDSLVRELHRVVLTDAPTVTDNLGGSRPHQHSTVYRVSWEMEALSPYSYLPSLVIPVAWDEITEQPINWVHAAGCERPPWCDNMPVLFSTECVPEEIERNTVPTPVCGGCMPVGGLHKHRFRVPTMVAPFRCRDTAVSLTITNPGPDPLSLQAFWRPCAEDIRCETTRFPLQISGLPPETTLTLDGISGRYWCFYDGLRRRPVGIVGTPTGGPWVPPVIDRQDCWDFVVHTAPGIEFSMELTLHDRQA